MADCASTKAAFGILGDRPNAAYHALARMQPSTTGNRKTRNARGDAVDFVKPGGHGGNFGVDLVGADHSGVGHVRGQLEQARLIEGGIEDQQ